MQIINSDSLAMFAGGLKEITVANVGPAEVVVATAFLLAVYYLPIVMYAIAPRPAAKALRAFSGWLLAHSRPVEIVTGLAFGVLFLWKGIAAFG